MIVRRREHILDVVDIIVVDQPQIRGASSVGSIRDGKTVAVNVGHGIAIQRGRREEGSQRRGKRERKKEREETGRNGGTGIQPKKSGVFYYGAVSPL